MSGRHHPERDLQRAVVALLRATVPPQYWTCPNVEVRGGKDAARSGGIARRRGSNAGWADVQIVNPRTFVMTQIELKSKRGVLSEEQRAMQAAWRERYWIVRDVDTAMLAIKCAGWDVTKAKKAQSCNP
jgi:hypothetical protein